MTVLEGVSRLGLAALIGGLAACGSAPTLEPSEPYWEQTYYQETLFRAVQSVVHTPSDTTAIPAGGIHATVRFTLAGGMVEYPEIVVSTGDPDLDKLLLRQIISAQPPKPTGRQADAPHEFELPLQMPTPFETFQFSIYAAINDWKKYPVNAVIAGDMGLVAVGFDYLDGKVSNVAILKSAHSQLLNRTSLETVTNAVFPTPPPPYADKTFHMQAIFCYYLGDSGDSQDPCPSGANVIKVTGTRVRRAF